MLKNNKYGGICMTCENDSSCTYSRNYEKPVFHCEEFNGGKNEQTKNTNKNIVSKGYSQPKSSLNDKDADKYDGLCENCENRKSCKLIKPEGGVWHCQEYR
ncbi:MAG: hypothetical protein V1709_00135 [Planctomycetota bacterium]